MIIPACKDPIPRGQGIEYIEVDKDDRKKLTVHFLESAIVDPELKDPKNYTITGGSRINVKVSSVVVPSGVVDRVDILLNQEGDFSIYSLEIKNIGIIDPFFATKKFSFKIHCFLNKFDCREVAKEVPTTLADEQVIDYMAKDYDSFRRVLIDLVPSKVPSWTDTSEADSGIVMVELFSHLADQLSYYQDRVANEAFLKTATQRISVKLHTDLIDYKMHNGASATTYLFFRAKKADLILKGFPVSGSEIVFELDEDKMLDNKFNDMYFYTWGNNGCYLPRGSTGAMLHGDFSGLHKGDLILIRDARKNNSKDDAYPWMREVVRLTQEPKKSIVKDPIDKSKEIALTEIVWSERLEYEYCLDNSAAIASGNIAKASHGKSMTSDGKKIEESLNEKDIPEIGGRLMFTLMHAPLTYLAKSGNPREAEPEIHVKVGSEDWIRTEDIFESGPFDRHYTVTTDNDGYGVVFFGNGQFGQIPPPGSEITISYRVGCWAEGNVGRDTLTGFKYVDSIESVTNPLPSIGGIDPERIEEVMMLAPKSIKKDLFLYRAITPEDYEMAAKSYTENNVQMIGRAKARFVWTGSWYTVFVSIDPSGTVKMSNELKNNLEKYLNRRKLSGYDLKIEPAVYVPLEIKLRICIKKNYFAKDVKEVLEDALSSKAFFHPDNFTFGDAVLASRLYRAIEMIPGVDSAEILVFKRFREPETATIGNRKEGSIPVGELEIARLDNDSNYPENGVLTFEFIGGK